MKKNQMNGLEHDDRPLTRLLLPPPLEKVDRLAPILQDVEAKSVAKRSVTYGEGGKVLTGCTAGGSGVPCA